MTDTKRLLTTIRQKNLADPSVLSDYFDLIRILEQEDKHESHRLSAEIRRIAAQHSHTDTTQTMFDIYRRTLLFDAPHSFDCYCRYIEWNREPDKRFYLPRRKALKPVVDAMQDLEDDKLDLLGVSLPPGTGKSTTAIFYLTWLAGKHPEMPILGGSHSNSFLRGVYDECLRIMDAQGEYLWHDVFPAMKVIKTNAQDMMIDIGEDESHGKRFSTLEFSSIGSGNAGKVRAQQLLYCDDLVSDIEQAMSRERMDKLWQQYSTDLRQRKIGKCKELHIATRWSLFDVLGRLETLNDDNDRSRFIKFPALDENDESNFDYGNTAGFTTQFFHEQREAMGDASWRALYMQQPIEREGQLYDPDTLRRYFDLPDTPPDAIIAVCDTKDKGSDFCVQPIAYQYGQDYYIEDITCDNSAPEIVEARLVSKLVTHHVHLARYESNAAGGKIAEIVQRGVKDKGGVTSISTMYTTQHKETKIIVEAPWVKSHCLFKDDSIIKHDKEYRRALDMLTNYTMAGKNKHDDVPDAFAQLSQYAQSFTAAKVTIDRRWY